VLAGELEDRVCRTISFLGPLDPTRSKLNSEQAPWRTKGGASEATAELVTRLDDYEVRDSLLCELACSDDTGDPTAEDEHLIVGFWRPGVGIISVTLPRERHLGRL
jgi:hypothetical protein